MRLSAVLLCLVLTACADPQWQEIQISLPDHPAEVTYLRKPMPNVWVGTEQYQRVRVADQGEAELPVLMSARDPVDIYLSPSGRALHFYTLGTGSAILDLVALAVFENAPYPDSVGEFVGALVSPEIADLRFVPVPEASPTYAPR